MWRGRSELVMRRILRSREREREEEDIATHWFGLTLDG